MSVFTVSAASSQSNHQQYAIDFVGQAVDNNFSVLRSLPMASSIIAVIVRYVNSTEMN